ncbi:hypothetical protein [Kutzneria buriramensis]|uniref:Uncharacterized protein n=1 Tax=Kutzneria buriramensis TaxID=1045776 RepID=A0A3E0GW38_9PSEU|nr:hypothetical protein [Kutzneria buriramensis]REH31078.1 hypothetical protein BCF44_122101 [Kutzneria buriramensis]
MRTISLKELHLVQHQGADGGTPTSDWCPRDDLGVGMLADVHQRWAVIEHRRWHGEDLLVQLCEVDGSRTVKPVAAGSGMYVRHDVVVDLADHRATLVLPEHAQPAARTRLGIGPVTPEKLFVGAEVRTWTTPGRRPGTVVAQTPCCGRNVTIAAVRDLQQFAVCCRHSQIYLCELVEDLDGGDEAVFTVLVDAVVVAAHRGVRH